MILWLLLTGLLFCLLLLLAGVLFIPMRVRLEVIRVGGSSVLFPAINVRFRWLGITFYHYRWPQVKSQHSKHDEERHRYNQERKRSGPAFFPRLNLRKMLLGSLAKAEIRYLHGYLRFGLVDAALTAWTGGLLWSVISVLLTWSQKKLRWKAQPVIEIYPDFCLPQVDFAVRLEADLNLRFWDVLRSNKSFC